MGTESSQHLTCTMVSTAWLHTRYSHLQWVGRKRWRTKHLDVSNAFLHTIVISWWRLSSAWIRRQFGSGLWTRCFHVSVCSCNFWPCCAVRERVCLTGVIDRLTLLWQHGYLYKNHWRSLASIGLVSPAGGNWGCQPYFFMKKTDDLFLFITVTFTLFWFHSGVTPWSCLLYTSDAADE